MKKGYTLAEVLIAIGVVGVISALMLPMINKIRPDATKVMYLRTYDATVAAVSALANNIDIYPETNEGDEGDYSQIPFYNTISVDTIRGVKLDGGNVKFCQAYGMALNARSTSSCKNSYVNNITDSNFKNNISFTTDNGTQFAVFTNRTATSCANPYGVYQSDIYFDVDGDTGKNCFYNETSCPQPDRFKLVVYANGGITAADKVGDAYLTSRANWIKSDLTLASNIELKSTAVQAYEPLPPPPPPVTKEPDPDPVPETPKTPEPDPITTTPPPPVVNTPEPEPVEPSEPDPDPFQEGDFFAYPCMKSYIASDGGYGDPASACGGGRLVYMEMEDQGPATQAEADADCKARGLELPYYFELSAAGLYSKELNLSSGNYWATPLTDGKGRNCYLPTGNCGTHNKNAKQKYRCIK